MKNRLTICTVALLIMGCPAPAAENYAVARELGALIGNSLGCGVDISGPAIQLYVEAHVPPDDISFAGSLTVVVGNTLSEFSDMPTAEHDAVCFQTRRAAKTLNLLRE